ncbi:MAG TPA: HAD family phosphatase [Chromobacteriaceae bacterium]|nr:HAD family phosphatase [Chromobacteriaceae bacterium]
MERSIDAVLFDLDGLMVDTESISGNAWRLAGQELGVVVPEEMILGMVGLSVTLSVAYAARYLGDSALAEQLSQAGRRHYHRQLQEGELNLKNGIENVLDWVVSVELPRAVATSTQRKLADIKLQRTGLSRYFDVTVAGDEVEHPKPHPDIYLTAARRLKVAPERCLVLEDSLYGMQAALAAGMRVIVVPDMVTPPAHATTGALAVCADLHQALTLLRQL